MVLLSSLVVSRENGRVIGASDWVYSPNEKSKLILGKFIFMYFMVNRCDLLRPSLCCGTGNWAGPWTWWLPIASSSPEIPGLMRWLTDREEKSPVGPLLRFIPGPMWLVMMAAKKLYFSAAIASAESWPAELLWVVRRLLTHGGWRWTLKMNPICQQPCWQNRLHSLSLGILNWSTELRCVGIASLACFMGWFSNYMAWRCRQDLWRSEAYFMRT